MTIRELLDGNRNIHSETAAYLNVIAWLQEEMLSVDVVNANKFCENMEHLLERQVKSWYLCFDQHDIDVIELRVTI